MRTKRPKINFIVQDKKWSTLIPDGKKRISYAIEKTSEILCRDFSDMEVSIVLSSDSEIRALNNNFRQKDKATNVLSFPSDIIGELGDIILGQETVLEEANDAHIPLINHTLHLIIHGFLHLLGYDHETETQALEMENMEIQILKELKIKNPYEDQ